MKSKVLVLLAMFSISSLALAAGTGKPAGREKEGKAEKSVESRPVAETVKEYLTKIRSGNVDAQKEASADVAKMLGSEIANTDLFNAGKPVKIEAKEVGKNNVVETKQFVLAEVLAETSLLTKTAKSEESTKIVGLLNSLATKYGFENVDALLAVLGKSVSSFKSSSEYKEHFLKIVALLPTIIKTYTFDEAEALIEFVALTAKEVRSSKDASSAVERAAKEQISNEEERANFLKELKECTFA